MSRRASTRLAWGLWLFTFAATVIDTVANELFLSTDLPYHTAVGVAPLVLVFLGPFVAGTVGAMIIARQPTNAVGWLFVAATVPLADLAWLYAVYGTYLSPTPLPATAVLYHLGEALSSANLLAIPYLMLLFPNGRFLSARWRKVGLAMSIDFAFAALVFLGPSTTDPNLPSPLGFPSLEIGQALLGLGTLFVLVSLILGVIAVVLRYRRSRGVERLQMKWMVYACALVLASVPTLALGGFFVFLLAANLLPVAAGMAILRHRLYDIDLLINRTLVYGSLSAVLAATYFLGVLAFETMLGPLTSGSEVAVALSTLAVVALFRPLRGRIQGMVDQRFYRQRYDAERTLELFSDRLREQIDLDTLQRELLSAVGETIQPVHAGVWLRRG